MIPVVIGPKTRYYVTDHHHLARALLEEGVEQILISPLADLRALEKEEFWKFMDNRGWMHPFDADGQRQARTELPKAIADLQDDPYRSLAGELRFAGGYAKDTTPFSEFLWADALRSRVDAKTAKNDPEASLVKALEFAKSPAAGYLPAGAAPTPATDAAALVIPAEGQRSAGAGYSGLEDERVPDLAKRSPGMIISPSSWPLNQTWRKAAILGGRQHVRHIRLARIERVGRAAV